MFEKFTGKARRTIFFARYEVSQLGGLSIGPEHLLLGLLREDSAVIPHLLPGEHTAVTEAIRRRVEERASVDEKVSTSVEIPLADEVKEVLRYAAEESAGMGHRHIGTEHLLLGLLRVEGSYAAGVLREHGIGHAAVREAVKELYDE